MSFKSILLILMIWWSTFFFINGDLLYILICMRFLSKSYILCSSLLSQLTVIPSLRIRILTSLSAFTLFLFLPYRLLNFFYLRILRLSFLLIFYHFHLKHSPIISHIIVKLALIEKFFEHCLKPFIIRLLLELQVFDIFHVIFELTYILISNYIILG